VSRPLVPRSPQAFFDVKRCLKSSFGMWQD
jgi:hypothetical protein